MIYESVNFISVTLTTTTIFLQGLVLYVFAPDLHFALKATLTRTHWTETQALKMGISLVIIGDILDAVYWGLAWTFALTQSTHASWWFHNGVYANLPFRQIIPSIGAALHLYAVFFDWRRVPWLHIILATCLTSVVLALLIA